jgi:hypothetical protein
LKEYVDVRFNEFKGYVDARIGEVDKRFSSKLDRLAEAFTNYHEFFIEFLSAEGVIDRKYRDALIKELRGVMRVAIANPFTKEEWERLRELFEKSVRDELTLDEADEFLELARKFLREYWNRREAYKLHIYATIVRALTYKKYVEMEEAQQKQEQKAQEGKE